MRKFIIGLLGLFLFSCNSNSDVDLQENILADYLKLNDSSELVDLVACAGGKEDGLLGQASEPTDVLFYPIPGATDFKYFEAENVADSTDFSKYILKDLADQPLLNGYMWKFNNLPFEGERMGVVTYKTSGKIHFCNPIRLKTNTKPTEVNPDLLQITENGIMPTFAWEDGTIDENVIYFQVISDLENNFISGTYTIEKQFNFYDLSNVVFNITDPSLNPKLEPQKNYKIILMGISEDNWVNFLVEKEFSTN